MCSVLLPSVKGIFTENDDWPGFGARNAVINVLTVDRAFSIAAFIFGSSSGTYVTLSAWLFFLHPARVTARIATNPTLRHIECSLFGRVRERRCRRSLP